MRGRGEIGTDLSGDRDPREWHQGGGLGRILGESLKPRTQTLEQAL